LLSVASRRTPTRSGQELSRLPSQAAKRCSWFVDEDIKDGVVSTAIAGQVGDAGQGQSLDVDEAFPVDVRGGAGQDCDRRVGHDLRVAGPGQRLLEAGCVRARGGGE